VQCGASFAIAKLPVPNMLHRTLESENNRHHDQPDDHNRFILKWINDRLCAEELRHGIVLVAGIRTWPIEVDPDELTELADQLTTRLEGVVESNAGVIQYRNQSQVVAFWNCNALQSDPSAVCSALVAAQQIVRLPIGTTRPCAVLNAGRIHVSWRADGTPRHMTSIATEEALQCYSLARPGEISVSPAADMIFASFAGTPQNHASQCGTFPSHDASAPTDAPRAVTDAIAYLARDPICCSLLPSTRAQLAHASGGLPDLACEIGHLIAAGTVPFDATRQDDERTTAISVLLSCRLDAFGPFKPLARATAIFIDDIDIEIMASAFGLDVASLAPVFTRAVGTELFEPINCTNARLRPGRLPIARSYRFTSPLLKEAAYRSLPTKVRRRLHVDIAHAMREARAAGLPLEPAAIADQFARGGRNQDAIRWWRRAAEGAIAESASQTAIAHLQTALDHIVTPAPGEPPARIDVAELTRLYGPQLSAVKGNASQEVLSVYQARTHTKTGYGAISLSERFDSLWGIQTCYLVRGELGEACRNAPELMSCAMATGRTDHSILASRLQGLLEFLLGNLDRASRHYAEVLALYEPDQHAGLRHTYTSDQATLAHAHLAWVHAIGSDTTASETSANRALEAAERWNHPHTQAHTVSVLAAAHLANRQPDKALPLALAGRAIARRHDFNYWGAWSQLVLVAAEGLLSAGASADELATAIDSYRATGARQLLPFAYAKLTEIHLAKCSRKAACLALRRGLGEAAETGIAVFSPILDGLAQTAGMADEKCESLTSETVKIGRIGAARLSGAEIHSTK
jgi:hypothetical protein